MKKLLFILPTVLLFASCGNDSATEVSLEGDIYTITSTKDRKHLGVDVRTELTHKVNKDTLRMIAEEIRVMYPDASELNIWHYTKGQNKSGIAWATTHFEPGLAVEIIGTTEKQDETADVEKFGLSMEERKEIFQESYRLEIEARKKADAKFPMSTAAEIEKNNDAYGKYHDKLLEEMQQSIMKKYNISDSAYWDISGEGVKFNWIPEGVY